MQDQNKSLPRKSNYQTRKSNYYWDDSTESEGGLIEKNFTSPCELLRNCRIVRNECAVYKRIGARNRVDHTIVHSFWVHSIVDLLCPWHREAKSRENVKLSRPVV